MTAQELFMYALDVATNVVVELRPEQMALATPDTEWSVQDLLAHMLHELAWVPDIVAGRTIAEVGDRYDGALAGDDPVASWRQYEKPARAGVEAADEAATAHLSYADKPVGEYLEEAANDQLIHAWDLGQAIGVDVRYTEAVARQLYERAVGRQAELAGSGLFAPPVEVAADADTQTKLLALLGRSTLWRTA